MAERQLPHLPTIHLGLREYSALAIIVFSGQIWVPGLINTVDTLLHPPKDKPSLTREGPSDPQDPFGIREPAPTATAIGLDLSQQLQGQEGFTRSLNGNTNEPTSLTSSPGACLTGGEIAMWYPNGTRAPYSGALCINGAWELPNGVLWVNPAQPSITSR